MVQIKRINQNDLITLQTISFEQFKTESWSKEQYSQAFFDANYIFLGCYDCKKLLSFVVANENLDDVNILMLATSESNKHKGCAKKLVENLQKYVKDKNKTLSLEVKENNLPAITLYTKLNFKIVYVRKHYYKDGQNAIIMFYNQKS